jgi:peptide/nickel transport system substrate-binding protein
MEPRPELTRRAFLTRASASAAVLTAGPLLAACGSTATGGGSKDSLNWALGLPFDNLNTLRAFNLAAPVILSLGLEGLMGFDDQMRLVPRVAKSVRQPDATTYVYTIREGVKFWDGTPLTVEDVVFSLEQNRDEKKASQYAGFFAGVKDIRATGANDVTITLAAPDPTFKFTVTQAGAYIQSKAYVEAAGKDIGTPAKPGMGTGPYKITKYVSGQSVALERNDAYWGTKPRVKTVKISVIPDDSNRLLALRSGEIDGTFDVPYEGLEQWKSGTQVDTTPSLTVGFITFNMEKAPWNDPHVRRAIAHALDKPGLVKTLLHGDGLPATGFVPPRFWPGLGVSPESIERYYGTLPQAEFSLDKAKAELAQSSVPDGFTATVVVPSQYPKLLNTAMSLAENVKDLGITIKVKRVPSEQWFGRLFGGPKKDLGLEILYYSPDYPDASNYIAVFLAKAAIASGFNNSSYSNAEVERLIAVQAKTDDPATRVTALKEILAIVARDLPVLPLWWENTFVAHTKPVTYSNLTPLYYYQAWASSVNAS